MSSLPDASSHARPVTKRRYIYEVLREKIRSGVLAPDSRVETTDVLAKEFGVSYLTVHAALRDLVQDGFLVRHQGRGTFVALAPEEKRSATSSFVVVTPVESDVIASNNSAQVLSILQGCSLEAQQSGGPLSILSLPTKLEPGDSDRYLRQIREHGSAVFIGHQYIDLMERLKEERFPACVIESPNPPPISQILFDRPAAIVMAIRHLIGQGHRRIGYFGSVNSHGGVKKKAYIKTLRQAGLPFEEGWLADHKSESNTYQLIQRYLTTQSLDAVFIDNYANARFVATVARECGFRVPDDLAILAYGIASSSSYETETLSHVAVPYEAMGREAIVLLEQIMRGEVRPPAERLLSTSLRVHRSCAKK